MPSDTFVLTSPAFEEGKAIPTKYAHRGIAGGQNISIPLRWTTPPEGTKSLALACVDLHPVANKWVHWLVMNIPESMREIPEGASRTGRMPAGCVELVNSYGEIGYGGPQPPRGTGRHMYETTLYALHVEKIELRMHTSISAFMKAIDAKVLGQAKMLGFFEQ